MITLIITCLIITQMVGYCKATQGNLDIEILQEGEIPFSYQGEQQMNYKMLKIGNNITYLTTRENTMDAQISRQELYQNEQYENLLQYGYPNKTADALGVNNEFEAYVATQEALYCLIEMKDPTLYQAEDARRTKNCKSNSFNYGKIRRFRC